MVHLSFPSALGAFVTLSTLATAFRPTQHCKALGDNGHYSACTSFAQHTNLTTGESDLFIRYHWYKYQGSKVGWHAMGLGERMAGALMFIMYGDPTASPPDMTFSIRSAEGHSPPQVLSKMDKFNSGPAVGRVPEVDVLKSQFETYDGPYQHPELNLKPSHVGIAEFIVRNYSTWIGTKVSNESTAQPMLWSSRHDQDFQGDYRVDRSIEAHPFGKGFGFMFVDLLNTQTPIPMFAPLDETQGHLGLVEMGEPVPPTPFEMMTGDNQVYKASLHPLNSDLGTGSDDGKHNPFSEHGGTTPSTMPPQAEDPNADNQTADDDGKPTDPESNNDTSIPIPVPVPVPAPAPPTTSDPNSQPAYTWRGKTLRDWLWHLHGLLLTLAFLLGYPAGIYLLRSPAQQSAGLSFNYHWTVNALSTVAFSIGCFIAYMQSRSINLVHQYVGIALAFLLGAQMLLGWRHHVRFMVVKRRTWMSRVHVWLGRGIMPIGFLNILGGMKLRGYGWFTMMLVVVLILIESVFGAVYLRASFVRRAKMGGAAVAEELKAQGPGVDDDAEEYFRLGDDDELSELSDEGEGSGVAAAAGKQAIDQKREAKREENERLARLDRV